METTLIILAVAVALALGWAFATWYSADQNPIFAPNTQGRVTFKAVVQNAFRDTAEITRPVWKWLWLNVPFVAVVAANGVILMSDEMRTTVFGDFWGGAVMVGAALLIRYGSTPAHPPVQSAR